MTDVPALPDRPGPVTDAERILAMTDEEAEGLWQQCLAAGATLRDYIGLLLHRELAQHGERGLAAKVAQITEVVGVQAATLSVWRRTVEERFALPAPSARVAAHRPARPLPYPDTEERGEHPSLGNVERITPDEVIQPEPPEPERPRPVHAVDRRASAAVTIELTDEEVAVLDAWCTFLNVRPDEVVVRLLRRAAPPVDALSPEAAALRRAFKRLTEAS